MEETGFNCRVCGEKITSNQIQCHTCGLPLDLEPPPAIEIPGYQFLATLGEGGMGMVCLAEETALGRRVAIKVVSERLSEDEQIRTRFMREARVLATVEHPYVVRVYTFGHYENRSYLVMEYVEGESLEQSILQGGAMKVTEALRVTGQCLEALAAAWDKDIVHRDIKPSNILLDQRNQVHVADFGLAKIIKVQTDSFLTHSGVIMGTPHYISPEQARGGTQIDFRSDIYSLGIVLFEMLTGEPPFQGASPMAIIEKHMNEILPPLQKYGLAVSDEVAQLLEWMTQKDCHSRPSSYQELLAHLSSVRQNLDTDRQVRDVVKVKPFPFSIGEQKPRKEIAGPISAGLAGVLETLLSTQKYAHEAWPHRNVLTFILGKTDQMKLLNIVATFMERAQAAYADLLFVRVQCEAEETASAIFRQILKQLLGDVEPYLNQELLNIEGARRLWEFGPSATAFLLDHGRELFETIVPGTDALEIVQRSAPPGADWVDALVEVIRSESPTEEKLSPAPDDLQQILITFLDQLAQKYCLTVIFDDMHVLPPVTFKFVTTMTKSLAGAKILFLGTYFFEVAPDEKTSQIVPLPVAELHDQELCGVVDGDSHGLPHLLKELITLGASELHLETAQPPLFLINNEFVAGNYLRLNSHQTKELCFSVLTEQQKIQFQDNKELIFSFGLKGVARFRSYFFQQRGAMGALFIAIPNQIKSMQELGLPEEVRQFVQKTKGLILVSGPIRSGISTTLAAMINEINHNQKKLILTIEDPIEYLQLPEKSNVIQREVHLDTDSFPRALQNAELLNPDVVMIGAMEDSATVLDILNLAEFGCLCLAPVKATSVAQTLYHIMEQFPQADQPAIRRHLSEVLHGIVCQDLITGLNRQKVLVTEVLIMNPALKTLLKDNKIDQIRDVMIKSNHLGMKSKEQALLKLFQEGQISVKTALTASNNPDELQQMMNKD
ncbi:ATPase, T2SS/T4P/T4SS family [candidate division CSSED10-310 bacterium]|uniref:ATPase, T2SS/T4P/T4SS family n=1 Tax=candidate division CSSED10-310 bacterium TaxID=2855610 RepID=A0ABV6Z1R9_UNCC1